MRICKTVREQKLGQIMQYIQVSILREINKERENLIGIMVLLMKVIFREIIFRAMVNILGLIKGHILDIGKIIKCMVKVNLFGQMAKYMKETIKMT